MARRAAIFFGEGGEKLTVAINQKISSPNCRPGIATDKKNISSPTHIGYSQIHYEHKCIFANLEES